MRQEKEFPVEHPDLLPAERHSDIPSENCPLVYPLPLQFVENDPLRAVAG
jgi:hypothetical protein